MKLRDLVGTVGDPTMDAISNTLLADAMFISPVSATAREAAFTFLPMHTHDVAVCQVCRDCDHSQKRDCAECGIDAEPERWTQADIDAWRTVPELPTVGLVMRVKRLFDLDWRTAEDIATNIVNPA